MGNHFDWLKVKRCRKLAHTRLNFKSTINVFHEPIRYYLILMNADNSNYPKSQQYYPFRYSLQLFSFSLCLRENGISLLNFRLTLALSRSESSRLMAFLISPPEIYAKIFFNPNPNSRNHKNLSILSNYEKRGSRDKVRVSGISGLDRNVRLYGQFSAPVKPSKEEEGKQNYYVNMGYAIRTIKEEFPTLFYRELSFDIYRDDVVFKDPMNTFVGIENYKSIFWALQFYGRIFFRALWLDIISVWQPVENIIMVRWTVHGAPRVPWESRGRFDGTSEYKLDKNGKIYEHKVDNVALNSPPPKFRILAVEELIQSVGCPSTPKPTYFEISSSERT